MFSTYGKLTQTSSILPIKNEFKTANSDTIVIIEITDCLLVNQEPSLKCKKQAKRVANKLIEQKLLTKEKFEKFLANAKIVLSNNEWPEVIKHLQDQEVKVFGLELITKNSMVRGLRSNEIQFSQNNKIIILKNFRKDLAELQKYTNNKNKKIIIISANRKFLEQVEKIAQKDNVHIATFEYTYLNNLFRIHDDEVAKKILETTSSLSITK